jgi:hypothetical protein
MLQTLVQHPSVLRRSFSGPPLPQDGHCSCTDKIDEYQAHEDIQVIMLVEPDVISLKVYRRDIHGLWSVEKYNQLEQAVDLPEVNSSIRLGDIYDTLEPKARPRLQF